MCVELAHESTRSSRIQKKPPIQKKPRIQKNLRKPDVAPDGDQWQDFVTNTPSSHFLFCQRCIVEAVGGRVEEVGVGELERRGLPHRNVQRDDFFSNLKLARHVNIG